MSEKQKNKHDKKGISSSYIEEKLPLEISNIIKFLEKRADKAVTFNVLYRHFHPNMSKQVLQNSLYTLIEQGIIQQPKAGKFLYNLPPQKPRYVTGKVDYVHPSYAYIIIGNGEQDVLVRQRDLFLALDRDEVKVLILQRASGKNHPVGRVVEILQRNTRKWLGTLEQKREGMFVVPTSNRMHQDIFIRPENLQGAKESDRIAIELIHPSDATNPLEGKIIEIFGPLGNHTAEMHMIMAEFDLSASFSKEILIESNAIPAILSIAEINRRKDYRKVFTLTIDPEDAKDFDDALSLQILPNGNFEVGIHIADVSYYVRPGSKIDEEAFKRGTSVYLVDQTVPMLPERLSNEVCSLRPREDSLTFSAVFELDANSNIQHEWFGETVIHSQKRLTYIEAQHAIENANHELHQSLSTLNKLAKKLRDERFKRGAINFETPTIKFKLDKEGKPLQVWSYTSQDSHRLIEEFMLLANKRVAHYVRHSQQGKNIPTFIYRIHEEPNFDKLSDFKLFVKQLGYTMSSNPQSIAASINLLSEKLTGKPEAHIVQTLAIRLMARAYYTTVAKPHFGLAFDYYTHFTSPIRRYPDLLVHRLLKQYLQHQFSFNQAAYEEQCRHVSERERIAAEAERASIKYKQVEFMQSCGGKHFKGIICSLMDWGIYIELVDLFCEGMVRLSDLKDDYYVLDAKKFSVVGKRTKKTYRLGDFVEVSIKNCDMTKRTIDLLLVDGVSV